MKDPTGKAQPVGGFQNGGWYSGYQYFNGSFAPQAGVIHPSSPQQGAGQMVSKTVNDQTNPANQPYIDKLNAQPVVNPSVQTNTGGAVATPGGGTIGGDGTGAGVGYASPQAPDLTSLYNTANKEAGITDIEKSLLDKRTMLTNTESKINDNPFLSEASRVGRISKVREKLNQEITNIQNDLALKKADVETKINIATKQFDINSQVAKDALSRANTLLEMGALSGASGEDIANLTRSTGISSSAWQSAIQANKDKNVKTTVSTASDDTGQYAVVINSQTGEIIAKNKIAEAKAESTTTDDKKQYYQNALRTDAQKGLTLSQIFSIYTGYVDPDTIYQLYNANSKYGADKGKVSDLKKYGVSQPGSAKDALTDILTGKSN